MFVSFDKGIYSTTIYRFLFYCKEHNIEKDELITYLNIVYSHKANTYKEAIKNCKEN